MPLRISLQGIECRKPFIYRPIWMFRRGESKQETSLLRRLPLHRVLGGWQHDGKGEEHTGFLSQQGYEVASSDLHDRSCFLPAWQKDSTWESKASKLDKQEVAEHICQLWYVKSSRLGFFQIHHAAPPVKDESPRSWMPSLYGQNLQCHDHTNDSVLGPTFQMDQLGKQLQAGSTWPGQQALRYMCHEQLISSAVVPSWLSYPAWKVLGMANLLVLGNGDPFHDPIAFVGSRLTTFIQGPHLPKDLPHMQAKLCSHLLEVHRKAPERRKLVFSLVEFINEEDEEWFAWGETGRTSSARQ